MILLECTQMDEWYSITFDEICKYGGSIVVLIVVNGLQFCNKNHSDSDCEICAATKLIHTSFHPNPKRASKPLELVHTNIAGPMRVSSLINNHRYVINFVDDYSRLII